jgi:hypothetical protein
LAQSERILGWQMEDAGVEIFRFGIGPGCLWTDQALGFCDYLRNARLVIRRMKLQEFNCLK